MALSSFSSRIAYPLANKVTAAGITLSVDPHKSLARLIDTAAAMDAMVLNDGSSPITGTVLEQAKTLFDGEDAEGNNIHDLAMDQVVHWARTIVNGHFAIARNRVVPEIEELVRVTEEYIGSREAAVTDPYHIRTNFLSDIYRNVSLADRVSEFAEGNTVSFPQVNLNVAYPGMQEAIASGMDDDINAQVLAHFRGEDAKVKSVFEDFFLGDAGHYRDADLHAAIKDADTALIVFLAAQGLLDRGPTADVKVSLSQYTEQLTKLMEFAGMKLAYMTNRLNKDTEGYRLATSYPAVVEGKVTEIPVVGEVYNRYLAEGGSPEAVMGAALLKKDLDVRTLVEEGDTYAAEWARYIAARRSRADFDSISNAISGLRAGLLKQLDGMDDRQLRKPRREMVDAINERLTHFHASDKDDLYLVATKAICRIFYPGSDYEKILRSIDYISRKDPEITPREAAATAQIDYVTDWIASSILIDGKPLNHVKDPD